MIAWQVWLIIAGVCLVLEIATVGFLIFWLAIAAFITSLLSLFIPNVIVQTAIFVILSGLLIFLTKPLTKKITKKDKVITNANSIIGKFATVKKEIGPNTAGQIKLDGDVWTAILDFNLSETIPENSKVEILKIDGVKAIVKPIESDIKSEILSK